MDYHPKGHYNGEGHDGVIVGWYAEGQDASSWYLYKVTDADWEAIDQQKEPQKLKLALIDAIATYSKATTYTQGGKLIASDASNLSTNATSLDLLALINGEMYETTETWPYYPQGDAYLQVDLTGKAVKGFYLSIGPREGGYMN